MKNYRKLVAAIVGIGVAVFGLDPGTAQDAVAVLTPFLVWLLPNG